ncbi:MAG: 4-hydroxythreonine-4-phosphate dehydrogenase PdxA [Fusobacteriota bacterium]
MDKILITMGDPAGIGPEIIVKYFNYIRDHKKHIPVVIGSYSVIKYYVDMLKFDLEVIKIDKKNIKNIKKISNSTDKIYVIDIKLDINKLKIGNVSKLAGEYTMKYLKTGLELVQNGYFKAMTTAPISKDAINLAGYKYSGHTTFLADKTNTNEYAMVLKGNKITVILNTTHLSIIDAAKKVKKESILEKIKLAQEAKEKLGIKTKIAVAGLNPHNGENGLFGNEEKEEILPAVREAQKIGIEVEGPIVPDTLFVKMLEDKYNIAVVMYHDQGLIPMKMESFGKGVNITFGLPIIRTSVDHGTAFDIAGKGVADYSSLKEAISCAELIIENS